MPLENMSITRMAMKKKLSTSGTATVASNGVRRNWLNTIQNRP